MPIALPERKGRGSESQTTSRSEQSRSKPARRNSIKNRTLRMPICMNAFGSIR